MQTEKDLSEILKQRDLFEPLSGSSILITGATGLIGSACVRVLREANRNYGLSVRILAQSRNREKAVEILGEESDGVCFLIAPPEESDCVFDYLIHTAAPTASRYFVTNPVETIESSVIGTDRILHAAVKTKAKRVLYLSSMEEYGNPVGEDVVFTEEKCGFLDHLSVRSCYPESKRLCENLCVSFAAEYQLPVMIARLAQTFGAGVSLKDNRVFMQFANSALDGKDIVLRTEGRSKSNFCYLTDTVVGLFTLLQKGKSGEAYNVCHDTETRRIREIAEMIAEKIAGGKIRVLYDIPEDRLSSGYAADVELQLCSDKLKALGWVPAVGMEEGYRRLMAYLEDSRTSAHSPVPPGSPA